MGKKRAPLQRRGSRRIAKAQHLEPKRTLAVSRMLHWVIQPTPDDSSDPLSRHHKDLSRFLGHTTCKVSLGYKMSKSLLVKQTSVISEPIYLFSIASEANLSKSSRTYMNHKRPPASHIETSNVQHAFKGLFLQKLRDRSLKHPTKVSIM